MTNTDHPPNSAVIISTYLQQLILHDRLAKAIEAQQKGGDYLPLLKSLRDCAESQGDSTALERPHSALLVELCSLAARADQQRSEPCADD